MPANRVPSCWSTALLALVVLLIIAGVLTMALLAAGSM